MMSMSGRFGPNGSMIITPEALQERTMNLMPAFATLNSRLAQEYGAATNGFATPTVLSGSTPPGLGFTFGQSWKRTQMGVMEFSAPVGQVANMEMALNFAATNAFVGKAMRMRTFLTCRGLSNSTANDKANKFFDQVLRELNLYKVYREATWLYYTVGCAPILLPEDGSMGWLEILDPRMVRVMSAYGKTFLYVVVDKQMIDAYNARGDKDADPRIKDYWSSMPPSWKKQIADMAQAGKLNANGSSLIKLPSESYLYLENRFNPIQRKQNDWDGIPLQPYFSACEQYRMALAAQFASSFLAKNLIALVSVGDPKAEGENYIRPDDIVNNMYKSVFSNPNSAMYLFGDPTLSVRYITPSKDAWASEQLAEPKEILKNLLPGPFWYSDSGRSFADATVEMRPFLEEIDACNDDFDRNFFLPIYERAADGLAIAKKHKKPPKHDRSSLVDADSDLQRMMELYNNGAVDIYSVMEAHGLDPDVIMERLKQQQQDAGTGVFKPAFEQKQGIVAQDTYGIGDDPPSQAGQGGKGGRPSKPGSRPQSESTTQRSPRPGVGKKGAK